MIIPGISFPLAFRLLTIFTFSLNISVANFKQPDKQNFPELFLWEDTCNVYLIKEGPNALLFNTGDGSIFTNLNHIGVQNAEWVLFTGHQRELTHGAASVAGVQLASAESERALYESPSSFRKMDVRLSDRYTVHGASYVRPMMRPIKLHRTFSSMDLFTWRGHEIRCVATPGNSPGGMSYFIQLNGKWIAITGGLMLEGARMHTWLDSEWDYGFGAGIWALANSAGQVAAYDPVLMLPSHGKVITNAQTQLDTYRQKLYKLERLLVRGYPVNSFASAIQDDVSRPTPVPNVWRVSPHLYKFRGPGFFPNFYLIISDSGKGLAVDCGIIGTNFLDRAIEGMQAKLGLKKIDAVIPTHMHGDHFLEAPHLRAKWGAQIWATHRMAEVCEYPERFDYCAPIQAYGNGIKGVKFNRLFKEGQSFEWEGYTFTVDWMPGQTEFALCLTGIIDGKKVAFTGDNLFGNPKDPEQTGHEAVVARNSGILEEGYIYGAEYLSRLKPDILLGGHSYVMDNPAQFIERYRKWSYAMRDAFQEMSSESDYRYWFDPFWVRAYPYRSTAKPGSTVDLKLHIRNFRPVSQNHQIEIHTPPGLAAVDPILSGSLEKNSRDEFPFQIQISPNAEPGIRIVAFNVILDGKNYGQRFDAIINVEK